MDNLNKVIQLFEEERAEYKQELQSQQQSSETEAYYEGRIHQLNECIGMVKEIKRLNNA